MCPTWTCAMLAGMAVAQPRPDSPVAHSTLWLNSAHLAGLLDASKTGIAREASPSPLSERGALVLSELGRRGLGVSSLLGSPALVASVVLAGMPSRSHVVPTEQYYYFEIYFQGEWIAGNLRTTDADRGILHCGYYLRAEPQVSGYGALTGADGLCISTLNTEFGQEVTVVDEKTGACAIFVVPDAATLPFGAGTPLLDGEHLVSPIIDESGTALNLLFNHQTCEFYYVLAAAPPDDPLHQIDYGGSMRGGRSGFIYVPDHAGRLILAGVNVSEISMNTFYDGPFDQVPPRLPLRDLIRWAYPDIEERRNDTLDPHGNWERLGTARVAIAAYMEYEDGGESRVIARAQWLDAARTSLPTSSRDGVSEPSSALRRFADTVHAHAKEWPQNHDLRRSASDAPRE